MPLDEDLRNPDLSIMQVLYLLSLEDFQVGLLKVGFLKVLLSRSLQDIVGVPPLFQLSSYLGLLGPCVRLWVEIPKVVAEFLHAAAIRVSGFTSLTVIAALLATLFGLLRHVVHQPCVVIG